MARGMIIRLIPNHGFGYVRTVQGRDLFFHSRQLQGVEYAALAERQQVEFEVGRGSDGCLEAVKVRLAPQTVQADASAKLGSPEKPDRWQIFMQKKGKGKAQGRS